MDDAVRFVPFGENYAGELLRSTEVAATLHRLEQALVEERLDWTDVGMLYVANAKHAKSHANQVENDQVLMESLENFCSERDWFPTLMGSSAFAAFFRNPVAEDADIKNGVLFVAVCSAAFARVPVVHEISGSVDDRPEIGRRLLNRGIQAFRAEASLAGVDLIPGEVTSSSTALLLTTGSGHINAPQAVDFKECYAIGQELLDAAEEQNATIVGGCATNKGPDFMQVLYYSDVAGTRIRYKYTYNHAGVLAFLPYGRPHVELDHPYKRDPSTEKLDITFNPHEQYQVDRSFFVEKIDGEDVIDFLERHWPYSRKQLKHLAAERIAIPSEPDAHLVTIASSLSKRDKFIWPNIPVWLEKVDGKLMMRMVRAEDDDANYYLMRLENTALRENARDLMRTYKHNFRAEDTLWAFLCESRKYVLNRAGNNAEAAEMIGGATEDSTVIGVYVNGEYSTGTRKSIGYHNYSQVGVVLPRRPASDLPSGYRRHAELGSVELFACHGTPDKPAVREIMAELARHLPRTTQWTDENMIKPGDHLEKVIRSVVGRNRQLVVAFLTATSVKRKWVQQEIEWALKAEQKQKRLILLAVVIDDTQSEVIDHVRSAWKPKLAKAVTDRHFVQINDFTEAELRNKAAQLAEAIAKIVADPGDDGRLQDPFSNL